MSPSRPRTSLGRLSLAALLSLFASLGCGGATSEPKSSTPPVPEGPKPVRVVVVTTPQTTGAPWDLGGRFIVRVEDAEGRGVSGVRVRFASQLTKGASEFLPTDTTTTDSIGIAMAGVKFGTVAGPEQWSAFAAGVATPATVDAVITHGTPMFLRISTYDVELFEAGDSASFQAYMVDGWENVIRDVPLQFQVSDPSLLSVTAPPTQSGNGWVRALRAGGSATFRATTVEYPPLVSVRVYSKPRTACTGIAAPQSLAVGAVTTVTDSTFCLAGNATGSGYAVILYNESTDGATSLGTTVTAYNVQPSVLGTRIPSGTVPSLSRSVMSLRGASAPKLDLRFHERLLRRSRSMRRLFAPARAARAVARGGTVGRIRGPSFSLSGSAPSVPAVDSLIALNVGDGCTTADLRTFRVEAVGDKAIVLADTANPTGGFTRTDYQRFAARFDTLVYPLDVGSFAAPTDIDGNGHVAILFTRAVNELTPANANAFIGGFFNPRDLFPRLQSPTLGLCPTSNEGEMFYMIVPDPSGAVNGNQFRLGFVDTLTTSVLAHEFQHLINASRRMYVNTGATDFEETWLDEGLSHTAEELLYFRETGFAPRSKLAANSINDTWAHFSPWVSDDATNFERFYLYLLDPAKHSPIDLGDELETRGATWAFLRFAVDKSFIADFGVWNRFANSTTTGFGTLTFALQRDPAPLLRDFAVANVKGVHPSWDFNSVFTQIFIGEKYPVPFGGLPEGVAVPVAAKGGSASYYRFGAATGAQTLLKFGSGGSPPNGNLRFMLVREY